MPNFSYTSGGGKRKFMKPCANIPLNVELLNYASGINKQYLELKNNNNTNCRDKMCQVLDK